MSACWRAAPNADRREFASTEDFAGFLQTGRFLDSHSLSSDAKNARA
jgi:hypothetical protein